MRTITVTELQRDLAHVLQMLEEGEEVAITRKKRIVARLLPEEDAHRAVTWPDFAARAKEIVSVPLGKNASDILKEIRQERV